MAKKISFKYDAKEMCYSPGLIPVYFNSRVLIKYIYDGTYACDFASDTYGDIQGDDFLISFGININGSVIAWLCDLEELPDFERNHWSGHNIDSEHEIRSQFYDAQINCEFTEHPLPIQCFNELLKLNKVFHDKYGIFLYNIQNVENIRETLKKLMFIINNREDDFKRFISELNEIINESCATSDIKLFLNDNNIKSDPGAKGNKILEKLYVDFLHDKDNLIAPFYYLYDLRIWSDHKEANSKFNDVVEKLNIDDPTNYKKILEELLQLISASCKKIQELIV